MCGIRVLIQEITEQNGSVPTPQWLERRGPDCLQQVSLTSMDHQLCITLQASVLNMRQTLVPQPTCIGKDAYLAWNGEVYQTRSTHDDNHIVDTWQSECSDTLLVADLIKASIDEYPDSMTAALTRALGALINAAYATVIVTPAAIYYARDSLGRRSLLVGTDVTNKTWQLASVADADEAIVWKEVEPGRLYAFNLLSQDTNSVDIPSSSLRMLSANVPSSIQDASQQLHKLLREAVQRRVNNGPVSILFSGGLDSAVLAALALEMLPMDRTLTLVNVCFVDDDKQQSTGSQTIAADTIASRASYQDLQQRFPDHSIRLLERQVDWTGLEQEMPTIQRLLYPKSSVMDLNIATALWFAASACPDRIILSGLGADELMGGYGRHRKAWNQGGEEELRQELRMDLSRLWERNLGRDDRVLSDMGHEARFPFLDPHVMAWLSELPLELVCDFTLPPGQGDKRILRLLAERLGLCTASSAVKRAIQFGSRMSHVSDKRRFGSRRMATRMDT